MSNPKSKSGPRCIALVGPYGSGKTFLLESIAALTGAVPRKGSVSGGHQPGRFLRRGARPADERGTQCPFHPLSGRGFHLPGLSRLHRISRRHAECAARRSMPRWWCASPSPAKVQMLQPFLKALSDAKIPALSLRQQDSTRPAARCASFWPCCRRPAKRRCCCARFRSGKMASPPALSIWRWSAPLSIAPTRRPEVIDIADLRREKEARFQMLERLADYDEHLMEELLGDIEPPRDEVFGDLSARIGRRRWWCRC